MNENPYGLDDVELERHAEALMAGDAGFGPEASVAFPNGFSMRTPGYPAGAVYVRVCAPDGVEIAYFDEAEFARDAADTLSTLIAHLDRDVEGDYAIATVQRDTGDNPHRLMPIEVVHRDATRDSEYGEETGLQNVANGFALTFAADTQVDYVRICDPDGGETAYWSVDEFAEDPSDVIGAMFGALVRGR